MPRAAPSNGAGETAIAQVAPLVGRIFRGLAGLQRGGEHARIGTDRQRVVITGNAGGDGHELAGAVPLRKRLRAPGRLAALRGRLDPDLEDLGRRRLQIVFGVPDARARAHHLHVTGLGAALVAERVLMGDRTFAHIGDDFDVGVGMRGKAGVRRDLVVVPDAQAPVVHIARVIVAGEREMMLRLQPAVVRAAEFYKWFQFDHGMMPF